jgi:Fe-S cluster assembly iron-binding protein IscA
MSRVVKWLTGRTFTLVGAVYISLFSFLLGLLIAPELLSQKVSTRAAHLSSHEHHHKALAHTAQPVPKVQLNVEPDGASGWRLHLALSNFTFTPEAVNQDNKFNTGHAHLYVNGKKQARLYAADYYLHHLPVGENTLKVTLNANSHALWSTPEGIIADTAVVTVE